MVVDGVVEERVPQVGAAVDFAGSCGLRWALELRAPRARPWMRCPPPSGILPSFLMSAWIKSPGAWRSY